MIGHNKTERMRELICRFRHHLSFSLVSLTCLIVASQAAHANERLLGGRAFTPPDQVIPMGQDWETRAIQYEAGLVADLAVSLDQQLYPALVPIIKDFAKARNVQIAVQNGTCGTSAGLLSDKATDMGGFCCAPGLTDRLPGLKYHTIGIGALALIVHKDNPIKNISITDARKLFGDDIRDWSELPMSGLKVGEHEQVRAIARLHCKLRPGHWRLILDTDKDFGWSLTEVSAIKDMVKQVSLIPGSIGYETLWHIGRLEREEGSEVKLLSVNGAAPTDDAAVASGAYPLYRVFNVTTWGRGPAQNALGDELAAYLIEHASDIAPEFAIVPSAQLRQTGWTFQENELVGEPK